MEVAIAFTLYLSFGAFLFFGTMGAPRIFGRLAIGLCGSELVATTAWLVNPTDMLAGAAGVHIPVLTGATLVLATGYGLHVARRW
jgi:hypothetical protein